MGAYNTTTRTTKVTDRPEFAQGKQTEKELTDLLISYGCPVTGSTVTHDIHYHIDLSTEIHGQIRLVDAKGMKKHQRKDQVAQEDYHWIELVNVIGKKGWLYGEATHIAFEILNHWVFVPIQPLQQLIARTVDKTQVVTKVEEAAVGNIYKRIDQENNRVSYITKVKTIELMAISDLILPKRT